MTIMRGEIDLLERGPRAQRLSAALRLMRMCASERAANALRDLMSELAGIEGGALTLSELRILDRTPPITTATPIEEEQWDA